MSDSDHEALEVQIPPNRAEVNRDVHVKISQRQSIIARLNALQVDPSQLSGLPAALLEAKLTLIERYYNSFDELQTQLENLDETQFQENHRSVVDETYCVVKALYAEKLSSTRINAADVTFTSTQVAPHPALSPRPQINLPKLKLSTFGGLHHEWLDFYNMFSVMVDKNPDLSDIEKFQYLRSSLTGGAEKLIQALEVTSANYKKALDLLEARFDHKRYIFQSHLQNIFDIQRVTTPSVATIRDFIDVINANVRAMQSLATTTQISNGLMLHLVVSKLDHETKVKWEEEVATKFDRGPHPMALYLPTWDNLAAFLERRCQIIDIIDATKASTKPSRRTSPQSSPSSSKSQPPPKQLSFIVTNQQKCNLCNESTIHNAFNCTMFMKLTPGQRYDLAKKKKLCLNCLGMHHMSKECPSAHRCQLCRVSHHTLLHRGQPTALPSQSPAQPSSTPTVLQVCHNNNQVLLATAMVQLRSPSGVSIVGRALLDSASQLHFITERMAQSLRLQRKKIPLEISGIGLCGSKSQYLCKVELQSQHIAYSSTLDAVIMHTITPCQPRTVLDISDWNIPKNINMADTTFNKPGPVDLLLGASVFFDLLLVGQIKLDDKLPILQKTKLGWVVAGAITSQPLLSSASLISSHTTSAGTDCLPSTTLSQSSFASHNSLLASEPSLDAILERFWNIEQPHQDQPRLAEDEVECEKFFQETTRRCPTTNKFIVRLPFKEPPQSLGSSYEIAKRRLLAIETKLRHNSKLEEDYDTFMREYIKLNHMVSVPWPGASVNYIPHHAVTKLDSTTTKLRVVFDASCRTSNGKSLNDILRVGPTIQDDIFSILIRFRKHRFVLMADIAKMYRQVIVDKDDAKWQCILWRDIANDQIITYQLQTVTYGTACAPYLATKCLQQLARDNSSSHPIGSSVVLKDFYVDNLMTGAPTIQEVVEIKRQVTELLNSGGFPLRKYASNDVRIIADVPEADREDIIRLEDVDYIKALGLRWSPSSDCFLFHYSPPPASSKISKRIILSHIARFFDPLGLLNPLIVTCKILMQHLWKLRLNWDESVPPCIHTQWNSFCSQLSRVENFRVARLVAFKYKSNIHAFADASKKAYGACIYVVSPIEGSLHSALLCAKSRVAPTKEVSLPRLELCAALLLAELLESVCKILQPDPSTVYCWTESMITLAWINGVPSKWITFVSIRVAKIQKITSQYQWRHIPGESNPADILSRGAKVEQLLDNKLWFNGPHFLTLENHHWPKTSIDNIEVPEQRLQHIVLLTKPMTDIIAEHKFVNSYDKLLRIFSYVRRFIDAARKIQTNYRGEITAAEINNTLLTICRIIQFQKFFDEMNNLQSNLPVHQKSSLLQLSPFLHEGVIRVGGRLKHSSLTFSEKHPILLPKSHPFVHTLIVHLHRQHLHAGCQTMLNILRERFWIVNARNTIKQVLHKCIMCYRFRPIIAEQLMGSLPPDRVTQSSPFEKTGVDYCGPLLITQQIRGRSAIKVYIAVFVCFSTKAVHLELVPDLTSLAFIAALKRFIARRGKCRVIYSDNATNFVGANRELREFLQGFTSQQHSDSVQHACRDEGIEWKFIPPRSPHFGGLWESAVKQAKHYLRRAVGTHILTFDELHTVCCQAEAMINSRPLTPMSSSPDDLRPLTPAHLLIGRSLTAIPEPSPPSLKVGTLKRYQLMQWIQQQFWERWSKDYLQELQQRKKWKSSNPNLQQNDLVLMQEDNTPPFKWPMGRIVETIKGSDGKVRVVMIKTCSGIHKRAITKVAKLPVDA